MIFVGAGLSRPLFPSWTELLTDMINECHDLGKLKYDKEELLGHIESGKMFLDVAEICADSLGSTGYREFIESRFDKEITIEMIPESYKELLELPIKTVLTTNYDRIPEIGSQGSLRIYSNKQIPEAQRSFQQNKRIVVKVHGDVIDQDSIVLTRSDYDSMINTNQSMKNFLSSLLSTKTFLFIGFSLSDPHLELILSYLNSISSGKTVSHYALLSEMSMFELDIFEKRFSVKAISYSPSDDKHEEVLEFIRILKSDIKSTTKEESINSIDQITLLVSNTIANKIGISSFLVNYNQITKTLWISLFSRSGTELELQKELLAIAKIFNFKTSLVESVCLMFHKMTNPSIKFDSFCPVFLCATFSYNNSHSYATTKRPDIEFWDTVDFMVSQLIGTPMVQTVKIGIPFIGV